MRMSGLDQAIISERDRVLADDDHLPPSMLESEALYRTLRTWFESDASNSHKWRTQAREDFDFVAGEQWEPDTKRALEAQDRPTITFNRVLSVIKAVAGIEINGRHETIFIPRNNNQGDVKVNELLTQASQWMADGCDAEDEQSEAFQDALVCGMGFTEQIISYDEDAEGKYVETKIDPLEMYWDSDARAKNIIDAKRLFRVRRMNLDEARSFVRGLGVNVPDSELNAAWASAAGYGDTDDPKPVEERRFRDENITMPNDPKSEVYIVQAQWWERERYWRVASFMPGQTEDLSEEKFDQFKSRAQILGIDVIAVPLTRRVYKQAFLGASVLGEVRPCPAGDRFNFKCITGERNRNKGTWFGLVRLMRDPQMWANKWLSQTLHILNTTAKGGIIAEADAFDDQRQAEDSYAQPDAITWAAPQAIQKGKIMQKPGVGIPTAYVNLLQFAISSIRDVTGINLELLGMRDVNQPGILEAQRKQAALTILATMFDSLRRFRKEIGRVRLYYIQHYLSDGRLIRIAGPDGDGFQLVPLLRDNTIGSYDVIVDDAPTSPNQKEQTWGMLMQLLPVFKGMITPEAAMVILEYSPLPSKVVEAFKALMQKPNPEAEAQKQLMMQKGQAEVAELQSQAALNMANAQKAGAGADHEKVKAVLDMAQAASQMGEAKLNSAQADYVQQENARRAQLDQLPDFSNPFLIEPQQTGGAIPQAPTLPVAPPSAPTVPQGPQPGVAPIPAPVVPEPGNSSPIPNLVP
jgi:hypothetical protein